MADERGQQPQQQRYTGGGQEQQPNDAYPLRQPAAGNRQDGAWQDSNGESRPQQRQKHQVPMESEYSDLTDGDSDYPRFAQQNPSQLRHPSPENDLSHLGTHPSMQSERSIYIGFDPSNSRPTASIASSSALPDFPPPPIPSNPKPPPQNQRRSGPPPTSRRAASSYYSQHTMMVSPIPEESGSSRGVSQASKHGSYASSAAIPTNWGAGSSDPYIQDMDAPVGDRNTVYDSAIDENEEPGLVRQASLGRKSKPTIVTTGRSSSARSRGNTLSGDELGNPTESVEMGNIPRHQRTASSGYVSPVSDIGSPKLITIKGHSSNSSKSSNVSSPLSQPPQAVLKEEYPLEKPRMSWRKGPDTRMSLAMAKELGFNSSSSDDREVSPESTRRMSTNLGHGGTFKGSRRLVPPRLNLDAVRDAEARGSLTSLPDLIRRATKLAAHLETGRPGSNVWGGRGSYMEYRSSMRTNSSGWRSLTSVGRGKDNDSLSDILASFPPPVLGGQNRRNTRMPQWPHTEDMEPENDGDNMRSMRQGRRICGLPLWAFILLIALALIVITAAVVVPLQLVNLSQNNSSRNDNASSSNVVARCKESTPCANGGENIATDDFCSCVCINGFTGADCSISEPDSACTNFDFGDRKTFAGPVAGIKNATIGSAIPRLFDKATDAYNIALDPSLLLGVFSKANVSCTVQNALVNFNGRTSPSEELRKLRRQLLIDNSPIPSASSASSSSSSSLSSSTTTPTSTRATGTTSTTPTATSTRAPALDQDALDFARVAVLYIAQGSGMADAEDAQLTLSNSFEQGIDFGDVMARNTTIQLDERSMVMSNGDLVGGLARRVVRVVRRFVDWR